MEGLVEMEMEMEQRVLAEVGVGDLDIQKFFLASRNPQVRLLMNRLEVLFGTIP